MNTFSHFDSNATTLLDIRHAIATSIATVDASFDFFCKTNKAHYKDQPAGKEGQDLSKARIHKVDFFSGLAQLLPNRYQKKHIEKVWE